MPKGSFDHPLLGPVEFVTDRPVWVRGDHITFTKGFKPATDVTPVVIPQLAGVPGANNGKLRFHRRAHAQLLMVFSDLERLGLMKHVRSCAGSLNSRLRKPVSGALSKLPSNHAFGLAIDLNADDKQLGASVAPVAPVFEALGFAWGITFNDPMHFEVDEFIAQPESVAGHVFA